jgi:hypothetical protein
LGLHDVNGGTDRLERNYVENGVWHAEAATVNPSEWDGIVCTRDAAVRMSW